MSPDKKSELHRKFFLVVGLVCMTLSSCKTYDPQKAVIDRYLRLAIALGERDPDALDFYIGSEGLAHEVKKNLPTLHEIARQAFELRRDLSASNLGHTRVEMLAAQLTAIEMRVEILEGKKVSFDEESQRYFAVTAGEDSGAAKRVAIRSEIVSLIGPGAKSYSAYERRYRVLPQRVPVVMKEALDICRSRTLKYIALPTGESVEVRYVTHKPWSAFSFYKGNAHSVIEVNLDFPLTVDRVLDLACHEGYPGHHVFNTLHEMSIVEKLGQQEGNVQLTFSPQSFISEAAASYAPEMVLDEPARVQIERDVLFPAAQLKPKNVSRYVHVERLIEELHTAEPGIARDYLDGRLEFARAVDTLERELLMEHGEVMLLYLNEYRSYMLAYTIGKDRVQQWVEQYGNQPARRWDRYLALMVNQHSNVQ